MYTGPPGSASVTAVWIQDEFELLRFLLTRETEVSDARPDPEVFFASYMSTLRTWSTSRMSNLALVQKFSKWMVHSQGFLQLELIEMSRLKTVLKPAENRSCFSREKRKSTCYWNIFACITKSAIFYESNHQENKIDGEKLDEEGLKSRPLSICHNCKEKLCWQARAAHSSRRRAKEQHRKRALKAAREESPHVVLFSTST